MNGEAGGYGKMVDEDEESLLMEVDVWECQCCNNVYESNAGFEGMECKKCKLYACKSCMKNCESCYVNKICKRCKPACKECSVKTWGFKLW